MTSEAPAAAAADGSVDRQARRRVRILVAIPVLVFVGLAALFAVRLGAGDPSRLPSALIGRPAPETRLPPLEGLADASGQPLPGLATEQLKGGVTVVNVWASWCGPCQVEHPQLMDLAKAGTVRLVGFNYKDKPEAARRFLAVLGNPYSAVGVDATGRTAIEWGVYGVPETFVLGADGAILHKHVGPLTRDSMPGFLEKVREAGRRRGG